MDWPEPQFAKLLPDAVLAGTDLFTPLQMGGWTRIWLLLHKQRPLPGLLQPMSLRKLQEWSRLPSASWEQNKLIILRPFRFHAATVTFLDPWIGIYYFEWAKVNIKQQRGGAARQKQGKLKIGPADSREIHNPYTAFSDSWEINEDSWPVILEILERNRQKLRHLQDTFRSPEGQVLSNILISNITSAATPALPAGASGAVGEMVFPPHIMKFLSEHDDAQLAALQRRWLAQTTPFNVAKFKDENPRKNLLLAVALYSVAKYLPAELPPPAEAGGSA